jgi:hypothetical protein
LIDFSQEQQHRIPPIRSKKAKRDDIENSNLSATQGLKMVQLKYHMLWPAMGPIYATNPKSLLHSTKVLFRMLIFSLNFLGCLVSSCLFAHTWLSNTSYILLQQKKFHSEEPASTSAPSTRCPLLLSCGWTSSELIFGFTLVTNSVGNRSHI